MVVAGAAISGPPRALCLAPGGVWVRHAVISGLLPVVPSALSNDRGVSLVYLGLREGY